MKNEKWKVILGSGSPRRSMLLKGLDIDFEVRAADVEENYPDGLSNTEIATYIAEKKAAFFEGKINDNELVITADTIVCINDQVLGKPENRDHAIEIIKSLSGRNHEVISGVCLKSNEKQKAFTVSTQVFFKELSEEEIHYYTDVYKPYDKAGAYGIQEWIGYIGVEKINGSFFNVMGLPVQKLYEELKNF